MDLENKVKQRMTLPEALGFEVVRPSFVPFRDFNPAELIPIVGLGISHLRNYAEKRNLLNSDFFLFGNEGTKLYHYLFTALGAIGLAVSYL